MILFNFSKIQDTEKLLGYRRAMLWIVRLCAFASVGMASGAALGLAFGFHTIEIIFVCVLCAIAMITVIPFLFFTAWIDEIEKVLTHRQIDFDCPIGKRVRDWALKMMLWFILAILLPILISKLTAQ